MNRLFIAGALFLTLSACKPVELAIVSPSGSTTDAKYGSLGPPESLSDFLQEMSSVQRRVWLDNTACQPNSSAEVGVEERNEIANNARVIYYAMEPGVATAAERECVDQYESEMLQVACDILDTGITAPEGEAPPIRRVTMKQCLDAGLTMQSKPRS